MTDTRELELRASNEIDSMVGRLRCAVGDIEAALESSRPLRSTLAELCETDESDFATAKETTELEADAERLRQLIDGLLSLQMKLPRLREDFRAIRKAAAEIETDLRDAMARSTGEAIEFRQLPVRLGRKGKKPHRAR